VASGSLPSPIHTDEKPANSAAFIAYFASKEADVEKFRIAHSFRIEREENATEELPLIQLLLPISTI